MIKIDLLISTGFGIIGIISYLAFNYTQPIRIAIVATIVAVWAITIAIIYKSRLEKVSQNSISLEDNLKVSLLGDMSKAFEFLKENSTKRISIVSYVGNYTTNYSLMHWPKDKLAKIDLRIILRRPDIPWKWPPKGTKQQLKRKNDIYDTLDDLKGHNILKHIAGENLEKKVRYFIDEPIVRVVLAEFENNKRHLFIGFYPVHSRIDGVVDFTGTQRPVLMLSETSTYRSPIISDFEDWYNFVWTTKSKPNATKKPLIAIDYDGVIANTNQIKSKWIKEKLDIDIAPDKCDRSNCVKIIGKQKYQEMTKYVYEYEATLKADPTPDLHSILEKLSKEWRFIIISARTNQRIKYAKEWLEKQNLIQMFEDVITNGESSKLEVAINRGATIIIDDDIRHLDKDKALFKIHFSKGNNKGIYNSDSWKEIYEIVHSISSISENIITIA